MFKPLQFERKDIINYYDNKKCIFENEMDKDSEERDFMSIEENQMIDSSNFKDIKHGLSRSITKKFNKDLVDENPSVMLQGFLALYKVNKHGGMKR